MGWWRFMCSYSFFQLKIIPKFSSLVIINNKTMTELTVDRDGSACHAVADDCWAVLQGDISALSWQHPLWVVALSCGSHDQPRYSSRVREWAKLPVGVSVGLCSPSEHRPRPSIKRRSPSPCPASFLPHPHWRQTVEPLPLRHHRSLTTPSSVSPTFPSAHVIWGNVDLFRLWLKAFDWSSQMGHSLARCKVCLWFSPFF